MSGYEKMDDLKGNNEGYEQLASMSQKDDEGGGGYEKLGGNSVANKDGGYEKLGGNSVGNKGGGYEKLGNVNVAKEDNGYEKFGDVVSNSLNSDKSTQLEKSRGSKKVSGDGDYELLLTVSSSQIETTQKKTSEKKDKRSKDRSRSRSKSRKPEDRSKKRGDERTKSKKKTREYRSNPRKRVSDRRHGGGDRHRDGEMRTARKKSTLVEEGGYVKMPSTLSLKLLKKKKKVEPELEKSVNWAWFSVFIGLWVVIGALHGISAAACFDLFKGTVLENYPFF